MKKKLTFVLFAVFMATSALTLYSAEKEGFKRIEKIEIRKTRGGDDMLPAGLMRLFKIADELELTNPQLLQLRMLFQKRDANVKKLMETRKTDKKLSDPTLTEEAVKIFAAEKAKALETQILARYQMQQDLKKIFTPEQCKKLEEMKAKKSHKEGMPFFGKNRPPRPFPGDGRPPRPSFDGDRPPMPFHMMHRMEKNHNESPLLEETGREIESEIVIENETDE
ncbi:MAG: hypothetical protein KKB51_05300 [Candidatus Riflebacteria bacterium]|nr:hypothetical protein [Candidatus Riflebacteria bacterium]